MSHPARRHLQHGVIGRSGAGELVRIGRHQFADRAQKIEVGEDHAWQQITLGKHADRFFVLAGHRQTADAGFDHFFEGAAGGQIGGDENRRFLDQVGQRGGHRLLLGGTLAHAPRQDRHSRDREMVELDLKYIREQNFLYDISLIFRTVWVMIRPNGAS